MSPTVPPTSFGDAPHVRFDFVRDVRDDLHGRAEIIAAPLFLDHRLVDLTRRDVVVAGQGFIDETLVVTEIEIGLGAVLGDEDLAVLIRIHRPRIDVDVGVELLDRDGDAAGLEQSTEARGGDPLAERTHHAAGKEDIFRHLGMLRFGTGPGLVLPDEARTAVYPLRTNQ